MKSSLSCDLLIVGGGVVGLAIATSTLQENPNLKVIVLEKENQLGVHASGRNSGVIHAGFYYSPESLKARFCRDGNAELRSLCRRHEIPIREVGKVVVARDEAESSRMETLFERGMKNGVELEILDEERLHEYEPLAKTFRQFLWSPRTAISSPKHVMAGMRQEFEGLGGKIELSSEARLIDHRGEIGIEGYKAKVLVNAAGAQADKLARNIGLAQHFAMVPFMGVYRSTDEANLPLRRLVYPVPHPINPFLGVHFTLTMDSKVKIGPTAIPILGREQYSWRSGWSVADTYQAIRASIALIRGDSHDFGRILKSELPKFLTRKLVQESATLVPNAAHVKNWRRKPPGIRSQLVDTRSGKLEQDFIVETFANSVHILNAVSPGWTSALPIGRWVAQEKVLPLLR